MTIMTGGVEAGWHGATVVAKSSHLIMRQRERQRQRVSASGTF